MKRVTASEARQNWFRLLDEVAAGEVVVIERKGQRIILRREGPRIEPARVPEYRGLIAIEDPESADRWTWEWSPGDLKLRRGRPR